MSLPSEWFSLAQDTAPLAPAGESAEPRTPARLQTMMLPNGRWLLVLDNADMTDALPSGLDRDELCARTGATAVLVFTQAVDVIEAYPEEMLRADDALIERLAKLGATAPDSPQKAA